MSYAGQVRESGDPPDSVRVYSAWIQLIRSSRLTVSSRVGWSVDMCPRIIPTT